MKTTKDKRAWMKTAAEEHGCMEPQRFCDSFDCTTVFDLIADVDEARGLLRTTRENYAVRLPPELVLEFDDFLKEPNDEDREG